MEVWLPVVGNEHYEVSSLGRVRSLSRYVPHWRGGQRLRPSTILRPRSVRGYSVVTLSQTRQVGVHRLVAEAFLPNPDHKPQVNHRDGDKRNNALSNLEWATASENNRHAFRTGLRSSKGERASSAKLAEADVIKIRERLEAGDTCAAVAADYPVTDRAISRIKRRVVWSHI